jgi:tetratricopeptide (TPR) repeat protein
MGVAYNGLGKHQEAIDAYKEAIKIKSDYYKAYYNRGVTPIL